MKLRKNWKFKDCFNENFSKIHNTIYCRNLFSCNEQNNNKKMNGNNPVVYFEIPVTNIERAEKFYTNVFNFKLEKEIIDDYEMMLFPFEETQSGIS